MRPAKVLHVLAALARIRRGQRRPLVLTWALTSRCNLACRYCERWDAGTEELDTAQACSVIDQLAALGGLHLSFSGGEPLLRDDLGILVEHAARRGLPVVVTTNGWLVPARLAALRGVRLVKLSLDGGEAVQDDLRGAGSFAAVMEAARALAGAEVRFAFNAVLSRRNLDQVEVLLATAERFHTCVRFTVINHAHAGSERLAGLLPDPAALVETVERIQQARRAGRPVANSSAGLRHFATWPEGQQDFPCLAGRGFAHLSADGRLHSCVALEAAGGGIDARSIGLAAALAGLAVPRCRACWCGGTMELNLMLDLEPTAILSARGLA